jgi:hypothetical protein
MGGERPSHDLDRLTVAEAAAALNVSQDAVRKRIARGTIAHDRDESGRVHVYVSPSETVHKTDQDTATKTVHKTDQDVYIRSLEDQIRFLREALERRDAVLLNLSSKIPQLEPPGSPDTREESTYDAGTADPSNDATDATTEHTGEPRRSWWRRMFGG